MGSPVTQDERVTVRDDWQVWRGAENELAGKNVFGVVGTDRTDPPIGHLSLNMQPGQAPTCGPG
jgi:hypothetical protein